jgi:hypothetical protein
MAYQQRTRWSLGYEVSERYSRLLFSVSKTEHEKCWWFLSFNILTILFLIIFVSNIFISIYSSMVNPSNEWSSKNMHFTFNVNIWYFCPGKSVVVCFAAFCQIWVCCSVEFYYPSSSSSLLQQHLYIGEHSVVTDEYDICFGKFLNNLWVSEFIEPFGVNNSTFQPHHILQRDFVSHK